jgi:trimethylamine:corrinoid methyltransferase-like protein
MPSLVLPKLTELTPEQIEYIHTRSLQILERAGVRVDSPGARRLLAGSQGVRWVAEDRATLEPALVEWAIQSAPPAVDLFDRRGQLAFRLGENNARQGRDRTRFGIVVTNLYYQDPLRDAIEPFSRRHMALSARLGENLPLYDVVSTIGVLQDDPPESADLYATLEMTANLEEIIRRGPGGSFLDADLTLKLYRKAYHESKIFPRIGLEKWQERGMPQGIDLLRQHTHTLLETGRPPEDHDELIARGEAFIQKASD